MTWELRQKSKRTKLRLDEIIRSIRKDQRKFNYKPRIRKTKKKFVISPRIWRWTNATSVSLIPKSTSLKAVSFTKTARGKWQKWWFFRRWFSRHSEAKTKQVRRFFASCQSRRSFALQSKTPPLLTINYGVTYSTFIAASVKVQIRKHDWSPKGFLPLEADF